MAHVRTLSGMNDSGFDASRSLLVLSTTKTSTLYLVEGGSDNLTVVIDDPEVASCVEKDETKAHKKDKNFTEWERSQAVHKLTIKGLKAGETTTLRAVLEEGGDPYGRTFTTGKPLGKEAKTQRFVDLSPANPLCPADIVLVRDETDWRHVALVWSAPSGDDLDSIDGNQKYPSIRRRTRRMKEKIHKGKDYALAFLHVDV